MLQVCLPISSVDFKLAVALLRRLASWRDKLQEWPFHIVCCWADKFDVEPLADQMSELFKNFRFHVMPDVPEDHGWPDAANHMFIQSADRLKGEPFYFMEADCFPIRADFLDQLNGEYQESGQPYMGAVNVSRWTRPDGSTYELGTHMVGCGIYPADFLSVCNSIHYLSPGVAWDVAIGGEVIPKCHETKLIAHRWGTVNYRLDEAGIIMDDQKVGPGHHSHAKPINHGAAVIHGAKDVSLYKLFN